MTGTIVSLLYLCVYSTKCHSAFMSRKIFYKGCKIKFSYILTVKYMAIMVISSVVVFCSVFSVFDNSVGSKPVLGISKKMFNFKGQEILNLQQDLASKQKYKDIIDDEENRYLKKAITLRTEEKNLGVNNVTVEPVDVNIEDLNKHTKYREIKIDEQNKSDITQEGRDELRTKFEPIKQLKDEEKMGELLYKDRLIADTNEQDEVGPKNNDEYILNEDQHKQDKKVISRNLNQNVQIQSKNKNNIKNNIGDMMVKQDIYKEPSDLVGTQNIGATRFAQYYNGADQNERGELHPTERKPINFEFLKQLGYEQFIKRIDLPLNRRKNSKKQNDNKYIESKNGVIQINEDYGDKGENKKDIKKSFEYEMLEEEVPDRIRNISIPNFRVKDIGQVRENVHNSELNSRRNGERIQNDKEHIDVKYSHPEIIEKENKIENAGKEKTIFFYDNKKMQDEMNAVSRYRSPDLGIEDTEVSREKDLDGNNRTNKSDGKKIIDKNKSNKTEINEVQLGLQNNSKGNDSSYPSFYDLLAALNNIEHREAEDNLTADYETVTGYEPGINAETDRQKTMPYSLLEMANEYIHNVERSYQKNEELKPPQIHYKTNGYDAGNDSEIRNNLREMPKSALGYNDNIVMTSESLIPENEITSENSNDNQNENNKITLRVIQDDTNGHNNNSEIRNSSMEMKINKQEAITIQMKNDMPISVNELLTEKNDRNTPKNVELNLPQIQYKSNENETTNDSTGRKKSASIGNVATEITSGVPFFQNKSLFENSGDNRQEYNEFHLTEKQDELKENINTLYSNNKNSSTNIKLIATNINSHPGASIKDNSGRKNEQPISENNQVGKKYDWNSLGFYLPGIRKEVRYEGDKHSQNDTEIKKSDTAIEMRVSSRDEQTGAIIENDSYDKNEVPVSENERGSEMSDQSSQEENGLILPGIQGDMKGREDGMYSENDNNESETETIATSNNEQAGTTKNDNIENKNVTFNFDTKPDEKNLEGNSQEYNELNSLKQDKTNGNENAKKSKIVYNVTVIETIVSNSNEQPKDVSKEIKNETLFSRSNPVGEKDERYTQDNYQLNLPEILYHLKDNKYSENENNYRKMEEIATSHKEHTGSTNEDNRQINSETPLTEYKQSGEDIDHNLHDENKLHFPEIQYDTIENEDALDPESYKNAHEMKKTASSNNGQPIAYTEHVMRNESLISNYERSRKKNEYNLKENSYLLPEIQDDPKGNEYSDSENERNSTHIYKTALNQNGEEIIYENNMSKLENDTRVPENGPVLAMNVHTQLVNALCSKLLFQAPLNQNEIEHLKNSGNDKYPYICDIYKDIPRDGLDKKILSVQQKLKKNIQEIVKDVEEQLDYVETTVKVDVENNIRANADNEIHKTYQEDNELSYVEDVEEEEEFGNDENIDGYSLSKLEGSSQSTETSEESEEDPLDGKQNQFNIISTILRDIQRFLNDDVIASNDDDLSEEGYETSVEDSNEDSGEDFDEDSDEYFDELSDEVETSRELIIKLKNVPEKKQEEIIKFLQEIL